MGDDAEYYMEQQEIEQREREAEHQRRVEEDARRNRQWEKERSGARQVKPKQSPR